MKPAFGIKRAGFLRLVVLPGIAGSLGVLLPSVLMEYFKQEGALGLFGGIEKPAFYAMVASFGVAGTIPAQRLNWKAMKNGNLKTGEFWLAVFMNLFCLWVGYVASIFLTLMWACKYVPGGCI